ncbi:MAG: hypothetical protein D6820_03710, partial [Lentisphaerae bacterium]
MEKKWYLLIPIFCSWLLLGVVGSRAEEEFDDDWGTEAVNRLKANLEIHGFISQGYMKSSANDYLGDSDDGTFENRELGLNFLSYLSPELRVGLQLMSYDLGYEGNNKVQIDWAYLDYMWKTWLGVRIGRTKIPLGLYGESRDFEGTRVFSLMPQSMYLASFRDSAVASNGISTYGNCGLAAVGDLDYT